MPTTRTICTECKTVVTLAEPAEVGDVVPCPKCESYFQVPKTKKVTPSGAAKVPVPRPEPTGVPERYTELRKPKVEVEEEEDEDTPPPPKKKKPVVVVEEDDEEEEEPRPKKKKPVVVEDDDEDEEEEEKPKKKKKSGSGSGKKRKKRKDDDDEGGNTKLIIRIIVMAVLLIILGVGIYLLSKKEWTKPDIVITKLDPADEDLGKPIPTKPPGKKALRAVDAFVATNDLKKLGIAYHNYFAHNNKGPASANDLLAHAENDQKLIDAVKEGVYVLYWNVKPNLLPDGSSNTILGYYHGAPEVGGPALFADGAARRLTKAEFDKAPKAGK